MFDFNRMLPPGVTCTLRVVPGFRGAKGEALGGRQRFEFQTGGPVVRESFPRDGDTIEEEQHVLLRFNGAVAPESD